MMYNTNNRNPPCGGCSTNEVPSHKVTLRLLRDELLYDVRNYAYIEAHITSEDEPHVRHTISEIGEAGNVDRVNRLLAMVHAEVIEALYPYAKQQPMEEEIDNHPFTPEAYVVELQVPDTMSRTSIHLISRLVHEYMVCRVLSDWLSILHPEAAAAWQAKAEDARRELNCTKHLRRSTFTRKLSPW